MRRLLINLLKVAVPLGLITWLCWRTWRQHPQAMQTIFAGQVDSGWLLASFALTFAAHLVGIVRWHLLLRGLNIAIRGIDTLRLGLLGYMLNLVAPGHVGGDLFKAVFVAREHPARRAAAVATILVDRVCGLYGLVVMTSLSLLAVDVERLGAEFVWLARVTHALTAIGAVGIAAMLTPAISHSALMCRLTKIPRVGGFVERLLRAVRMYQMRWPTLVAVGLLSISIHSLLAGGVYCAARGIYHSVPPLSEHFVISPLSTVAGAVPLTPGGLGSFELALTHLYDRLSPADVQGRGIVIALFVRMSVLAIAGMGGLFYFTYRREMQQSLSELAHEQPIASRA